MTDGLSDNNVAGVKGASGNRLYSRYCYFIHGCNSLFIYYIKFYDFHVIKDSRASFIKLLSFYRIMEVLFLYLSLG